MLRGATGAARAPKPEMTPITQWHAAAAAFFFAKPIKDHGLAGLAGLTPYGASEDA